MQECTVNLFIPHLDDIIELFQLKCLHNLTQKRKISNQTLNQCIGYLHARQITALYFELFL